MHQDLDEATAKALEPQWAWKLWRSGLQLWWGELLAAEVRERPASADPLLGADDDGADEIM